MLKPKKNRLENDFAEEAKQPPRRKRPNMFAEYATRDPDPAEVKPLTSWYSQVPETQTTETQAENTQVTNTKALDTQAPITQAIYTQASRTQVEDTQAPTTQAQTTQVRKAQAPETQALTTRAATSPPSSRPSHRIQIVLDDEKRENMPRVTNCYTAIPNEVFDNGLIKAIIRDCKSVVSWAVWLFMYRWSYGFRRNYTQVSIAETVDKLGVSDRSVKDALKHLQQAGYIRKFESKAGMRSTYIVGRPSREGDTQAVDTQADTSPDPGTDHPTPGYSEPNKKEIEINFKKNQNSPLNPPASGGNLQLKIQTARWRDKAPIWEPWDDIHTRLRDSLDYDDFQPLSHVSYAIRGLGNSIHIRGSGLTPEVLNDRLKEALAAELAEQGIDTIRIAV